MSERGFCQCGCGQSTRLAPQTDRALGWVRGEPIRFVVGHNTRSSPIEYLKQDRGHDTLCWVWQLYVDERGYGRSQSRLAHRVFYEREHGPIPGGLPLDHLCRQTDCVNPAHLEPVTADENRRRAGQQKLEADNAREVRRRLEAGEFQREIAADLGVDQSLISLIKHRKVWANV